MNRYEQIAQNRYYRKLKNEEMKSKIGQQKRIHQEILLMGGRAFCLLIAYIKFSTKFEQMYWRMKRERKANIKC